LEGVYCHHNKIRPNLAHKTNTSTIMTARVTHQAFSNREHPHLSATHSLKKTITNKIRISLSTFENSHAKNEYTPVPLNLKTPCTNIFESGGIIIWCLAPPEFCRMIFQKGSFILDETSAFSRLVNYAIKLEICMKKLVNYAIKLEICLKKLVIYRWKLELYPLRIEL
jgi:hypothetical protein